MGPTAQTKRGVLAVGALRAAVLPWRFKGGLHVTVIAKASYAFTPDGVALAIEPQPVIRDEVTHDNSPARSVRLTTDLVPYLERADVLFTGHAHAPRGAAVEVMDARLGLFDGARALLDKSLRVRQAGGFREMPLTYERAFGGAGWVDNPYGGGATEGSDPPNVLDPQDERRSAGFGPIGQYWTARKRLLRSRSHLVLDAPVLDLPDDLDWSFFQAAPPDQRVPHLRGDEWIVLEGLHPALPCLRTRLPGATGLARIHGLSPFGIADGWALPLCCDMLRIEGDEQRCTLTFRGNLALPSDDALAELRVVAGVELPGRPIAWPDSIAALLPLPAAPVAPGDTSERPTSPGGAGDTISLTDADLESVGRDDDAASVEAMGARAGTLVLRAGASGQGGAPQTIDLPGAEVAGGPLPFVPPGTVAERSVPGPPGPMFEETIQASAAVASAPALPFHGTTDPGFGQTMQLRGSAARGPALPFTGAGSAAPDPAPPAPPSRPIDHGATLVQTAAGDAIAAHRTVMPFAAARAPEPAAPPDEPPSLPAAEVTVEEPVTIETVGAAPPSSAIEPPPPEAPPAPAPPSPEAPPAPAPPSPEAPPAPAPPPPAVVERRESGSPWAPAEQASPSPPPVRPRKPPPAVGQPLPPATLNRGLYGRFGGNG